MRSRFLPGLLLLALLVAPFARPAPLVTAQAEPDEGGQLGTVHFATSCSPAAQEEFDRAVAMLHSFWFAPSRQAFTNVTRADPTCGMAYWGIAMTWLGNPLAAAPPPRSMQAGWAAVEQARAAGARTQREHDYIEAIAAFYDPDAGSHRDRAFAYEAAMEAIHRAYPDDSEAAIFYALALNVTATPTDKTFSNTLRAAAILDPIFAAQPTHPGIAHYLIHSYDYPPLADQGLDAARRYAGIAPAAPHAQHMPSHIFTRLGYWQESIDTNLGSLAAARAGAGLTPDVAPPDMLHPMDYMMYGYLQLAQDEHAKGVLDNVSALQRVVEENPGAAYALAAIPARWVLERNRWAEAAALTAHPADFPWERFPHTQAVTGFARAIGAARAGDVAAAREAIDELDGFRETLNGRGDSYWAEQVDIQRQVAAAWLARAEGRNDVALTLMRAAADREDLTDKHPVTPGPILPARELLGELLLLVGEPQAALEAFERSQRAEPNRFKGLYGAARAAAAAGDGERATRYYADLLQLAASADTDRAELQEARAYLAR
jgi:hypothetical protein